jgi:site-specific DNA-methyltransferase (adenine-specific)
MNTNLIIGDCVEKLKELESNSVDAIITDPPYGLEFMGKDWDKFGKGLNIAGGNTGKDTPYARSKPTPSFFQMSKGKPKLNNRWQQAGKPSMEKFDGHNDWHSKPRPRMINDLNSMEQFQKFTQDWATECLRILKHGGFLLSFGGTRTYHRMVCGIEDAGFEIRDTIMWLYGSGFPKSLNIGKQIDKMNGNEREVVGIKITGGIGRPTTTGQKASKSNPNHSVGQKEILDTKGTSEWEGWGTALKPAVEPIVVARKPLSEKNVALNVLKHGTGGINIDACRIGTEVRKNNFNDFSNQHGNKFGNNMPIAKLGDTEVVGRFPANIILDEEAGKILDKQSGILGSNSLAVRKTANSGGTGNCYKTSNDVPGNVVSIPGKGGASRFFYCAKASKSERNFGCEEMEDKTTTDGRDVVSNRPHQRGATQRKNNHPTVKPIALIEYLIKLVSKKGAIVLDPFLGSGTTAIACLKLNRQFIGIEKEEEYIEIAKARIKPFIEQKKL